MDNSVFTVSCFYGQGNDEKKALWEITDKCNQNCVHCCNRNRRDSKELNIEEAKKIVLELKNNGISKVILTGGEPLLYKDFFELADFIKSNSMEIVISTNGLKISEYKDQLIKLSPRKLVVSLDGFSSNSHDKFRGVKNAFYNVFNGIESIKDYVKVEIHSVINKLSVGELKQLVDYCKDSNIRITFNKIVNTYRDPELDKYMVSDEEYNFYINKINKGFTEIRKIRTDIGVLTECQAGTSAVGITSKGLYTPCLWISNYTDKFNSKSIQDIFNFGKHKNQMFPLCNNCDVIECKKGCLAMVLGGQAKLDPLCIKNVISFET